MTRRYGEEPVYAEPSTDGADQNIADADLSDVAPWDPKTSETVEAPDASKPTAKPDALDTEIMRQLAQQPPPLMPSGAPPPMPVAAPPGADDVRAEQDAIGKGAERDKQSSLMRAIELASKQLTAGVLRQPMAELASPEKTNYEGEARALAEKGEQKRYSRGQAEIAAAHQRYLADRQAKLDERSVTDKAEAKARQAKLDKENEEQRGISNGLRKEGIDATKSNTAVMQSLAVEGMRLRKDEHEDKKADREDAKNNASTTFDGVKLVAPRGIDKNEAKEVHDKVGMYNAAFEAFDSIDDAIKEYVAHPSISSFNNINSRSRIAAAAMTSAVGGGAMAEAEANAAIAAMGANPASFLAGKALFDSQVKGVPPEQAAAEMLSKLKAARSTLRRSGLAKFKGNNFAPEDDQSGGNSGGLVTITNRKTGKTKQATPAEALRFKSDPDFEVR
jgi:hypothetical protein